MPRPTRPGRSRCEPLEPRLLLATFTVSNTDAAGPGSLSRAILDANATPDADVIAFNIGGAAAVKTITPTTTSLLPTVTAPVTIDGTTQPGYAGSPVVEVSGVRVTSGNLRSGIMLGAGAAGSVVRGLVVNQWQFRGFTVQAPNCTIERNYVGADRTGMIGRGNGIGVYLSPGMTGTRIAANVISGNDTGIYLVGQTTRDNVIVGNMIGVNAAGTAALANPQTTDIELVEFPTGNRIGGPDPADRNVIGGGPSTIGIRLDGDDNEITGNLIGVLPNGAAAGLGVGVSAWGPASGNEIRGNTIAFNGTGVSVTAGERTAVVANSIYSNQLIGIDLGPAGATANDPGDTDTGPNNLQNYPVITSAIATGGQTVVAGALDSLPLTRYRVDLYASDATQGDSSGFGEGARPVGLLEVVTGAAGHADFTASVSPVSAGDVVAATASRVVGEDLETSEFSRPVAALSSSGPFVRQVYVRGSEWDSRFMEYLEAQGMGHRSFGYAVPDWAAQLAPLPWANIGRISIQFSEPVTVHASDLTVHGVRVADYPVATTGFNFDARRRTATWVLATPISADRVMLHLEGDVPAGLASAGRLLDGEWANGADAYPSGDGTLGGDFDFQINVLAGDVMRSGAVLADDFSQVKQKFFSSITAPGSGGAAYSVFADVNGSGSVLADDFSEVKKRFFTGCPRRRRWLLRVSASSWRR